MTSVREALDAFGRTVSIKAIAHQRGASFPVSLRKLTGALPPGQMHQKVISLDFLQRKLNQFFNDRRRPLFKVRLHNKGSGDHRHSTVDVLFDDVTRAYSSILPGGAPHDLGQLEAEYPGPNPDVHFNDVNSRSLNVNVIPGAPVGIAVDVRFETAGEVELIVNNHPDINFTYFHIHMPLFFDHDGAGLVNLRTDANLIKTSTSVDVSGLPDGVFDSRLEKKFNSEIAAGVEEYGDSLNRMVTRWLVGGDFHVVAVEGNEQTLTIHYIIPRGQLAPFPENPQPPLDPGRLANIDHVVVLMMENRSFDHMLGYLSKEGGRSDIDGLRGGEKNSYNGRDFTSFLLPDAKFDKSPPHNHEPIMLQIGEGRMDGFVSAFAQRYEDEGEDPARIMGYHNKDRVPVYDALATHFLVCQRWFAAHPGPTFPNRFYTLTGRLNRDPLGTFEVNNPGGATFKPVQTKTLFDHLTEHGVSWRYFEHRYCFLRLFARYSTDDTFIVEANDPARGFFASAAAGTLPSVSFIDPNFIDERDGEDNDDGAPANIGAGQNLIGRVVNALMRGPKWQKTMLIITYDEHGGFYDHVNPLLFRDKAKPVSGIDHYGVRVPTFVISPWVDQRAVSNIVFDHTAIAKTIARRFMSANPPDMGARVAAANDLSMVLRATPRLDLPVIPVPRLPRPTRARDLRVASSADTDDFKELMRAMYAQHRARQ
ncbi:MAG: hypothetical protein FJ147_17195 [Deltaproteobacteria bacterium]|nr:hypothetical protein [Deltaproteobacteria bacterium]